MAKAHEGSKPQAPRIDAVEITGDTLTGRGGLALFVRYLDGIGLAPHLERLFGGLRKSGKGRPVSQIFTQLFCFFLDGTSRHLVHFDRLKEDAGYAGTIESTQGAMASSHQIKRFYAAFSWQRIWLFRRLLQHLFLWRLKKEAPAVVVLGMDTMVMDNDEAEVRHGVEPTYKKVKGFQPLQLTWGRFMIDAVFRGGKKHSNHGSASGEMIRHTVRMIRKHYRADVPIVLRLDSGFFDQKLFAIFEELGIGYVGGGKLYDDLKEYVGASSAAAPDEAWSRHEKQTQVWEYMEFADRRRSWTRFRRAIFCRPMTEDEQQLLSFARPETVLYTNLGRGERIDSLLAAAGLAEWTRAERVIEIYHGRGADELVHRALKEFAFEELPFKRFAPNAAFYYTMLVAFFLMESFKEDVCAPVVPITARATRLRREIIDIAAKLVRHAGRVVLKVTASTWRQVRMEELWARSVGPPPFAWGG